MTITDEYDEETLKPTLDEVEGRIAFIERQIAMWKGIDGYIRTLSIELCALRMLRDHLMETAS